MRLWLLGIILLLLGSGDLYGVEVEEVRIGLFSGSSVQSLSVTAHKGRLEVSGKSGHLFTLKEGEVVYVQLVNRRISVYNSIGKIAEVDSICLNSFDREAVYRVHPVNPLVASGNYKGSLFVSVNKDRLKVVNAVDPEVYIAGVVEAEVGLNNTPEFYKAKSIICRTFLYGNARKHKGEGYHLCDGTHCQAFKGITLVPYIQEATIATAGIILTDQEEQKPISALYHANCGGETEAAANVWSSNLPYLIPIEDRFCKHSKGATWTKKISLNSWLDYLFKKGLKLDGSGLTDLSFEQLRRIPEYKVGNISIPTKQLRSDWQLRSAFFSIYLEGDNVILEGRGYGHGVGLCQEGAMEMGRQGYSYGEIISHYYKFVNLISIHEIELAVPQF